ncbi:hypothetical protein BKA62DRAFT_671678 [Auriculariales sp. MPI-PUGE-AT-0066]|nr:hypothetical protein BKA62DRAFT_671678 [Auriculariales sp. MPI-PUGE-AT-0066]
MPRVAPCARLKASLEKKAQLAVKSKAIQRYLQLSTYRHSKLLSWNSAEGGIEVRLLRDDDLRSALACHPADDRVGFLLYSAARRLATRLQHATPNAEIEGCYWLQETRWARQSVGGHTCTMLEIDPLYFHKPNNTKGIIVQLVPQNRYKVLSHTLCYSPTVESWYEAAAEVNLSADYQIFTRSAEPLIGNCKKQTIWCFPDAQRRFVLKVPDQKSFQAQANLPQARHNLNMRRPSPGDDVSTGLGGRGRGIISPVDIWIPILRRVLGRRFRSPPGLVHSVDVISAVALGRES